MAMKSDGQTGLGTVGCKVPLVLRLSKQIDRTDGAFGGKAEQKYIRIDRGIKKVDYNTHYNILFLIPIYYYY